MRLLFDEVINIVLILRSSISQSNCSKSYHIHFRSASNTYLRISRQNCTEDSYAEHAHAEIGKAAAADASGKTFVHKERKFEQQAVDKYAHAISSWKIPSKKNKPSQKINWIDWKVKQDGGGGASLFFSFDARLNEHRTCASSIHFMCLQYRS